MGRVNAIDRITKARIIAIMTDIKVRLRRHRITVGSGIEDQHVDTNSASQSLVDIIRMRGCEMPGSRFSDIFLSRPTRMVNASVHELVTTFEVILDIGHHFMPADELIELCELTRVPFGVVQQFARYYPVQEWRLALHQYSNDAQLTDEDEIIERDVVLDEIELLLVQALANSDTTGVRHVIVSGPSGIGKTAVAIAAARRIERTYARRIPIVMLGAESSTVEQICRAIGVTIGMKLIGTEPWALRMRNTTALRNAVVILDNLIGAPGLSLEAILHELTHTLPMTLFLVTTQIDGLAQLIPRAHGVVLQPLNEDQSRRLFWRIYRNANGRDIDPAEVTRVVAESYGFPMHIIACANAAANGGPIDTSIMYQHVVAGIPTEAVRIVQLLALVQQPVSLRFLTELQSVFRSKSDEDLRQIVQQLERRQIITLQRNEGYVMHDALRSAMQMVFQKEHVAELLAHTAPAIHTDAILREDDLKNYYNQVETHEVLAVLELVGVMKNHGMFEAVGRIAVHWRMIWIRFGLCAEWCAITDDVARALGEDHELHARLMYTLGSFYGHRGMVDRTVLALQRALRTAEQRGESDVWAMAALECALHGLQSIGMMQSENLILRAIAQFERLKEYYWVGRCYDTMSYIALVAGKVPQALKANDEALMVYGSEQTSFGRGDAHANRGLIYMTMGDYSLARQELMKAEHIFHKLNASANTAAVHLRIAAICVLWNHASDARYYLVKAFHVLERCGGLNDVLFVIDICAGLAIVEGYGRMAIQLSAACTELRQHLALPRGEAFDAIVVRQLSYAQELIEEIAVVPLSADLMDLMIFVRKYLKYDKSFLEE